MNRMFCILIALACLMALSQLAVQAQVIIVDDGTAASTLDAPAGVTTFPAGGVVAGITIDAAAGGVEIIGATTTTFGATVGVPTVTINNVTGDITSTTGVITGATVTDGTASMSAGVIDDGAGGTITGGVVTGATFTDGTASMSAGVIDDGAGGTITGGVVTGVTLTDGTASMSAGVIDDGAGGTITGGVVTGVTLTDGIASMSAGVITDGVASLTGGAWTGVTSINGAGVVLGNEIVGLDLSVVGATTLATGAGADQFTVAATGATTVGNTLAVTGNTTLSTLTTTGLATLASADVVGDATVGGTLSAAGGLATIDAGGGFTAVGVDAGTGLLEGIGGLEVTSPDGLQTINVNDSGTFIDGTDALGNASILSSDGTSSVVGAMDLATGNTSVMTVNGLGTGIVTSDNAGVGVTTFSSVEQDIYGTTITATDEVSGDSSSLSVSSTSIDMTHTNITGGLDVTGGMDITGGIDNNGYGIINAGRIQGVADGIAATDAVNVRQLDSQIGGLDESLSSGIASIAALAAIPNPVPGKNTSIGIGFGNYNSESALALGIKANIPQSSVSVAAGVGFAKDHTAANVGVSFSF